MATKPISSAKVYLITSEKPCSATLTQGEHTITWEVIAERGQATVIVPAGATLELSTPLALLTPLPFEGPLAVGNGSSGGCSVDAQGITPTAVEEETPTLQLAHGRWFTLFPTTTGCALTPAGGASVVQAHLILTPADTMPTGWLTATGGAVVRWPFGELAMPAGWSYIVTLVQVGKVIFANALPVDLSTPA